jgi:hypothetical protein
LAELDGPHLYRYVDDPADEVSSALGKPKPLRPVVPLSLSHLGEPTPRVEALVDSGSERVLAAPSLARTLNIDLEGAVPVKIGIGGASQMVRFASVELRLYRSLLVDDEDPVVEWTADVGFFSEWRPPYAVVLGRDGFLDRFTMTMHGGVPAFVIEPWSAFDGRFKVQIEQADTSQPRFKP